MRPPGPLPASEARGMLFCAAMARARGLALIPAAGAAARAQKASAGGPVRVPVSEPRRGAGVGAGAGAAAAEAAASASSGAMSSSASAITPMRAPTGAFPPAGTSTLRRTPAPSASISMLALSVSISASTSPTLTASPSDLFHVTTVPSSIVGELGQDDLGDHRSAPVARPRPPSRAGEVGLLEALRVRHGNVGGRHAQDRRVEVVEALALDAVGDLGAEARVAPALLDHHAAVGLRRTDSKITSSSRGRRVRGSTTSASMPSVASSSRRLQRDLGRSAPSHDRDVLALPLDLAQPEGDRELLLRDLALEVVEHLVLHEDDRIVVPDRALEEALGVPRGRGHARPRDRARARTSSRRPGSAGPPPGPRRPTDRA